VARVVAFVPDLLFGSNLLGQLQAGGHEVTLVSGPAQLAEALTGAEVLIVDLTAEPAERIAQARDALAPGPPRTVGFFAHVEKDVRTQAEAAGFDLVVPRSRMARAAAELVSPRAENAD
jgi:hypothetical protein